MVRSSLICNTTKSSVLLTTASEYQRREDTTQERIKIMIPCYKTPQRIDTKAVASNNKEKQRFERQ